MYLEVAHIQFWWIGEVSQKSDFYKKTVSINMIPLALFPSKDAFILKGFDRYSTTSTLRISLQLSKSICNCPVYDRSSDSVHSIYDRTVKDLPWNDYGLVFLLKVRKHP